MPSDLSEHEHDAAEVGPLGLGNGVIVKLVEVDPLGVQPEALARRDGALVDRGLGGVQSSFRGLGDGRHYERLHAHLWVVRVRLE